MGKQFMNLPAPHEAIRVRVDRWSPSGPDERTDVEYIGPSLEALRAADCISDRMLELFTSGRKGRKFEDENGCSFHRRPRRTAQHPQGVEVTRWIHYERAGEAPGVAAYREMYPHEPEPSNRRQLAGDSVLAVVGALDIGNVVHRARRIGRQRRPAQWSVIEKKLIIVDWKLIQARSRFSKYETDDRMPPAS